MMLTIIFVDSALEPVPKELWSHPSVKRHSERIGKPPKFIILDRSYHHAAMMILKDSNRRGRPDLIHFCLLEALGSPLNREGLLKIYVHTFNNQVIQIAPHVRLPKNYNRFIGLMEQLFQYGRVPLKGEPLLILKEEALSTFINNDIKPSMVIAFTRIGEPSTLEDIMLKVKDEKNLVVLIGGFPFGHFSESITALADKLICIDPEMLESWTVTSRLIYEYERMLSIPKKRLFKR